MNMTSIYLSNPTGIQSPISGSILRVSNRIRQALVANRARRAELHTIRHLRSLDRAILEDIGVDLNALNDSFATITRANPYMIAIASLSGGSHFHG
jgi:hypothetical protein